MARASLAFAVATALAVGLVGPAQAAAPRLIMLSGQGPEPVVVSDAQEVFDLYQSFFFDGAPVSRSRLDERPSLRLALFWNNFLWDPYVRNDRLAELRPIDANQFGRLYPAVDGKPALVDLPGYGNWPKIVGGTALRILQAHRVPVGASENEGDGLPWPEVALVAGAVSAAAALLVAWRRRRTRLSRAAA